MIFLRSLAAIHILRVNCAGFAGNSLRQSSHEIFSIKHIFKQSQSRIPMFKKACVCECQRGVPPKSGYFTAAGSSNVKTVAELQINTNMLLIVTSTGDELFSGINIDDLQ